VRAISSPTAEGGITGLVSGLGGLAVGLSWPFRPALLDAGWAAFSAVNLIAIFAFGGWETIPFRPTADRRWQLGRLDKVTVQADRERLSLAVDALLENAVRHTASGDVIKLSVVSAGPGGPARMIVSDTRQGIPAELVPHVFDRFRSGDNGPPRGTGLGLALVSAVARAHGGDVQVRSTPGQGSVFELLLPRPPGR
jgi:signal transduction histidine kinase